MDSVKFERNEFVSYLRSSVEGNNQSYSEFKNMNDVSDLIDARIRQNRGYEGDRGSGLSMEEDVRNRRRC